MAFLTEHRHGQWVLRKVSDTLTMIRDGERVPMGEVIYQGTKAGCRRAEKQAIAESTLIHAMRHIDRNCEYSPANGMARRILENLLLDITA